MSSLPIPNAEAKAHSQQLAARIQQYIQQCQGWISFADFMQMALYEPQLGYYSGGAKKFGIGGDFVTAPEISPLFAQTLAQQAAQVLAETHGSLLELGAGTGRLAADMLLALDGLQQLPQHYYILEVSAHLRQVQRETLEEKLSSELMQRVVWLDTLPQDFVGMILGNEVLDAIPVHLIHQTPQGMQERGVAFDGEFFWKYKPLQSGSLHEAASALKLPQNYLTEICPAASGLIASLANVLKQGVILMLDYGFAAHEYYHPQRDGGTLMCHYQHYAHTDPLIYAGLQDITAHVDFTRIAQAGVDNELELLGFCSQAQFLMNCGILQLMSAISPQDMSSYAPLAAAAQKLLSPAEMGDLFKVIAFGKAYDALLLGFGVGDKCHTL